MTMKKLWNGHRDNPTAEVPSVSRGQADSKIASPSRNSLVSETAVWLLFVILDETLKSFPKFKVMGIVLLCPWKYL